MEKVKRDEENRVVHDDCRTWPWRWWRAKDLSVRRGDKGGQGRQGRQGHFGRSRGVMGLTRWSPVAATLSVPFGSTICIS